jgi:hypothetical protein
VLTRLRLLAAAQGSAIVAGTAGASRRVDRSGCSATCATFFLVCYLDTAGPAFHTGVAAGLTSLETAMLLFCTVSGLLAAVSVAVQPRPSASAVIPR